VPGRLVATVPAPVRESGASTVQAVPWLVTTLLAAIDGAAELDLLHSHLDWAGLALGHASPVPVVATIHGRIDMPGSRGLLAASRCHHVAISGSQAGIHPAVDWAAVVHNGLDLSASPFGAERSDDLCFVGRLVPEKGVMEAIEVARLSGRRLRIAAKVGAQPSEVDYYERVVRPAFATADVDHLGELSSAERDELYATSYATLMPGNWPEPFGLVAIESLACGTPVLARRVGALPEIIREGIDGYFGDDPQQIAFHVADVGRLDRASVRSSVLERFSAARMADGYLDVYRRVLADRPIDRNHA
jgi:glycosyltransferase involved in cell wall biosynthesis